MCGNGSRAAVHFANRLEIIENEGKFWVQGKGHKAKINKEREIGVEIHLRSPKISEKVVSFREKDYTGFVCDTGVPHYVFLNLPFSREEFRDLACMLVLHSRFNSCYGVGRVDPIEDITGIHPDSKTPETGTKKGGGYGLHASRLRSGNTCPGRRAS